MARYKKQVTGREKIEKQEVERNDKNDDAIPYIDINSDTIDNSDIEINGYTYTQLENMTARQLSEIASNYINASPETIQKWAKKDIIKVIQNKGYDKEAKPRASQTKTDAQNLINGVVDFLDAIKFEREEKKLYKPLKDVFTNNSVNVLDEKINDGSLGLNGANKIIIAVTGGLLLFDALVGFKNIKEFYKKVF